MPPRTVRLSQSSPTFHIFFLKFVRQQEFRVLRFHLLVPVKTVPTTFHCMRSGGKGNWRPRGNSLETKIPGLGVNGTPIDAILNLGEWRKTTHSLLSACLSVLCICNALAWELSRGKGLLAIVISFAEIADDLSLSHTHTKKGRPLT